MSGWYKAITNDPDNYEILYKALEYFEKEHGEGRRWLKFADSKKIIEASREVAGEAEYRYAQCQELEAILSHLERQERKARITKKRWYLEKYPRELNDRQASEFSEIEPEVLALRELMEYVVLVRDKFAALSKGIENIHYQIGNITKMRIAGIEDATL